MSESLFSTHCYNCENEYVIGVVLTMTPALPDNLTYCPHCGSSNTAVQPEENVLKSSEVGTGHMTGHMTAQEIAERQRMKTLRLGAMYGNSDAADALTAIDFAEIEKRMMAFHGVSEP